MLERIKRFYDMGLYTAEMVHRFVDKGVITAQQYLTVTGGVQHGA